jgi:hypothetical protein
MLPVKFLNLYLAANENYPKKPTVDQRTCLSPFAVTSAICDMIANILAISNSSTILIDILYAYNRGEKQIANYQARVRLQR